MNYTELQKANNLLEEIGIINNLLQVMKDSKYIRISTSYRLADMDFDSNVFFSDKHKDKISEVIKGIRDELVEELEKLGVTEYDDND